MNNNKSNNVVENANLPKHDYAQSLQKFVMEKLNCLCHLECIESYEPLGYFCKVSEIFFFAIFHIFTKKEDIVLENTGSNSIFIDNNR